jgi:hypothetical protein
MKIYSLILIFILFTCLQKEKRDPTTEDWYEMSTLKTSPVKKLIKRINYKYEKDRLKTVTSYDFKLNYLEEFNYDDNGLVQSFATFYDSLRQGGSRAFNKYEDKILVKQKMIFVDNGIATDSNTAIIINEFDSLKRVKKSISVVQKTISVSQPESLIYEYSYSNNGQVSSVNRRFGNVSTDHQLYYYSPKNVLQEYIFESGKNKFHHYLYYTDTLLTQTIITNGSDTLTIEKFGYDENGLKNSIETFNNKNKSVKKIQIEYKNE